ncbi:MAG TPA: SRPBCC domain-containing protein [Candidatus Binatia bacterium]|jgi:hypothetical protein
MKEVHTEIAIDADRQRVWSVLANFAAYSDWNPFLRSVATTPQVGAPVGLTVALGRRTLSLDAAMLRYMPEREVRWAGPRSRLQGMVFRGEHYFIIEDAPSGVRFVHGECFEGLAIPFMGGWIDRNLAPAYQAMNVALKRRAEGAKR